VVRGGVEQPASMPLVRYEVRCEYSLANPELYRSAAPDDPEALLEGVAMAGLVGIVRQLGDLAEYAPLPLLPLNLVLTVLDIDIGQGLGDGSGPNRSLHSDWFLWFFCSTEGRKNVTSLALAILLAASTREFSHSGQAQAI